MEKVSLVSVSATPEHPAVLRGVSTRLCVVVSLETGASEKKEQRAPFDLAVVLDRSGSMNGEKLENSKEAIVKCIENLTPQDSLSFFTYDDSVQTVIQDGDLNDKEALTKKVKNVHTGGMTNISSALVAGGESLGAVCEKGTLLKAKQVRVVRGGRRRLSIGRVPQKAAPSKKLSPKSKSKSKKSLKSKTKTKTKTKSKRRTSISKVTPTLVDSDSDSADAQLDAPDNVETKVTPAAKVHDKSRPKRIFLFSDGNANVGLRSRDELGSIAAELVDQSITVSSFGIGKDFDEDVMQGIADAGTGQYFHLEKAHQIPLFVEQALQGLLGIIGTESVISFRGRGCAVVKRVYGQKEGASKAVVGDIRESNLKRIVVELEMSPSELVPADNTSPVMEWELSFLPAGADEPHVMKGEVVLEFTNDAKEAEKENEAAKAIVLSTQAGEVDKEVLSLLDAGDRAGALKKKEEAIELLETAEKLDPSNKFFSIMLKGARKNKKDLRSKKKSTSSVRQRVQYGGYLQRRNSICALDAMDAIEDSESDSEEWVDTQQQQQQQRVQNAMVPPSDRFLSLEDSDSESA